MALSLGLALLLGVGASACAVSSRTESTANECRDNGIDEDLDGLVDCGDPDCWIFDFCGGDQLPGDAATSTKDAGNPSPGSDAGKRNDGGNQGQDAAVVEDSGTTIRFDATLPPETCGATAEVCTADQTCIDGGCANPPDESRFLFRVTSAAVPDQRPTTLCFDVTGTNTLCSVSPAAICGACKPDPFVVVSVNGVAKLQTPAVEDSLAPSWSEPKTPLALFVGDIIDFTVRDYDPAPLEQVIIYSCQIEFTAAMAATSGLIQCYPLETMTIPPPLGVKWVVTAEYEPQPSAQ